MSRQIALNTINLQSTPRLSHTEYTVSMVGDIHIHATNTYGAGTVYDASDLYIPPADLIIGMGDLVESGSDAEYDIALQWAQEIKSDFIMVKGNHDNGAWTRYAKQIGQRVFTKQLPSYENPGAVKWSPMVWEPTDGLIVNFPRQAGWDNFPVQVQPHIIKVRDLAPAYYTFEADDILFICLDTSNWLLGAKQMQWLKQQVKTALKPVVLVGHHHSLPVGIIFDTCQLHERDFMRRLMLENKNIIAYLHGHAHKDRWWKYGHVDILAVRNRACRTVTFKNGKVTASILDGKPDKPEQFHPTYLCGQCLIPGQVVCLEYDKFINPWGFDKTSCYGWLQPNNNENIEITWSMRLPENTSYSPENLAIQLYTENESLICVESDSHDIIQHKIPPQPEGGLINIDLKIIKRKYFNIKLYSQAGPGIVAIAAEMS